MERIRRYANTDLKGMMALDLLCFTSEFVFDRNSMRRFAEAHHAMTFIAEAEDSSLIGFVIAHLEPLDSRWRGYIVTLDVAPTFRLAGTATRLMQRVEDEAAAKQAFSIDLHVYVKNDAAIKFYEARQYRRISLEEGFYGRVGLDAYVYRKLLLVADQG